MFITVEMEVGSIALGLVPATKAAYGNIIQDMVLGEVTNIDQSGSPGNREITINAADRSGDEKSYHLPEYRIAEYDFGGVNVDNPWFDAVRIQLEDAKAVGWDTF